MNVLPVFLTSLDGSRNSRHVLPQDIIGADDAKLEIAFTNSLTTNLHLLMTAFYRPHDKRNKIMIEAAAFPSDRYAASSHILSRGLNPVDCLIEATPSDDVQPSTENYAVLPTERIIELIDRNADTLALVMLSGIQSVTQATPCIQPACTSPPLALVNGLIISYGAHNGCDTYITHLPIRYITGQFFDIKRVTAHVQKLNEGKADGDKIMIGWDLAHAVGNVPLKMHDWGADFAAFCTYKSVPPSHRLARFSSHLSPTWAHTEPCNKRNIYLKVPQLWGRVPRRTLCALKACAPWDG
jgi:kynureninase